MNLYETYWNNKYLQGDTGWDIGQISTPLKQYFDQLTNKDLKILVPGGGNSYEAEYLHINGFKNVYVADISKAALKNIQLRVPGFPKEHLIHRDFFDLEDTYDLIIEQTFFCAIDPSLRTLYVLKTNQLLREKGKLIGLLFNIPLNTDSPPYGGNKDEYQRYFEPYFTIEILETAHNSIDKRAGNELFIKLIKKSID